MAQRITLALAVLELVGYVLVAIAAGLVDLRAGVAAIGIVLVLEAREAMKP